jgi:hypothetical protein
MDGLWPHADLLPATPADGYREPVYVSFPPGEGQSHAFLAYFPRTGQPSPAEADFPDLEAAGVAHVELRVAAPNPTFYDQDEYDDREEGYVAEWVDLNDSRYYYFETFPPAEASTHVRTLSTMVRITDDQAVFIRLSSPREAVGKEGFIDLAKQLLA